MKAKTLAIFFSGFFISNCVFSQDTSANQKLTQDRTYEPALQPNEYSTPQPHIYRDTRLGSSSPLYNTYQKNDYGAGSITTNPNKGSGSTFTPTYPSIDSSQKSLSYPDTRLGSSSPLYNTYQKNVSGAGAITTNPNKSSSGGFTPPAETGGQISQPDSLQNNQNSVTSDPNKH
ncbi:MAG TPA: hypothetical protein VLI68_04740 [Hanamia sp.]|jgi:hypothetical protein|nr:hypothetical protein [Hanamia sp.]